MTTNGTSKLDHAISNSFVSCCLFLVGFLHRFSSKAVHAIDNRVRMGRNDCAISEMLRDPIVVTIARVGVAVRTATHHRLPDSYFSFFSSDSKRMLGHWVNGSIHPAKSVHTRYHADILTSLTL